MTKALHKAGKISNLDAVLKALMDREARDTTAFGHGLAFPHARIDGLKEPVALLAVSKRGIDFKARDGHPTYLFFLFLTPTEETELHLQILSESAAIFTDKALYHSLRKSKSSASALSLILHHEKGGKEAFYPLPIEEIYEELGTNPAGLSDEVASIRLERYGPNVLRETKGKSLIFRFAENLINLLAVLLWVGGVLSFVADMPELGWAIFAVILINAAFSFWQEYRAERALEALKRLLPRNAKVLRDGVEKGGIDIDARKKALPRIAQLPFEAVRKRMTTINLSENKPMAYVKGAPKETFELCTSILINGREEPLTDSMRDAVLSENDSMANEGLRVLGVAYRALEIAEGFTIENTEKDLVFIGLVGMVDPARPEVPEAIGLCHRAGIRVVMVTGDYGLTALSIAKKIGLTKTENPRVITGSELSEIDGNGPSSLPLHL